MEGVRKIVVVNEVGEVCLNDFVQLAEQGEEVVVEKGVVGMSGKCLRWFVMKARW